MLKYFRALFAARRAVVAPVAPAVAAPTTAAPAAAPKPVAPGKRRRKANVKAKRRQPAPGTYRIDPNQPLLPQMKGNRDAWY